MRLSAYIVLLCCLFFCRLNTRAMPADSLTLQGKLICIDPGHGGTAETDVYRKGPQGEREEWINLRVALLLKDKLEQKGARVILTRNTDVFIKLEERSLEAIRQKAGLFLSIHHNATADSSVNFPIIYFHGAVSENKAGVQLGTLLGLAFQQQLYRKPVPVCLASDYVIFPARGAAVLRNTYGIPAVLAEASFFTNPSEEQRLMQSAHNEAEARAYLQAVEAFFRQGAAPILPESISLKIPPFQVLEEAGRTDALALNWAADFQKAMELVQKPRLQTDQEAFECFSRSASSFPDSYLAQQCHEQRAEILGRQNKTAAAETERLRAKEFYLLIP